jgi:hypothetical protein
MTSQTNERAAIEYWDNWKIILKNKFDRPIIIIIISLQPFVAPWTLLTFLILYTGGRTPWTGDQSVARPLPKHRTT